MSTKPSKRDIIYSLQRQGNDLDDVGVRLIKRDKQNNVICEKIGVVSFVDPLTGQLWVEENEMTTDWDAYNILVRVTESAIASLPEDSPRRHRLEQQLSDIKRMCGA